MHFAPCKRLLGAAILAIGLAGCAAPTPAQYAGQQPALDITRYFNGTLDAHGMFQDRSGAVIKRFVVVMRASWQGDTGILDEDFTYADGQKERRVWHLKKQPGGRYTGTASDVVGEAEGRSAGNAFQWAYTLRIPLDGKTVDVQFDDWMFLMDDHVMINKAVMRKFGIKVGEVTVSFHKP